MRKFVIKRTLWNVLKYLLAFGLLGYVFYANWDPPSGRGLKDVWQAHVVEHQPIDTTSLAIALIVYTAGVLVTICRWHILVRAQGLPSAFTSTLRIGLLGYFFSTFLPGSVGGDLVKVAAVVREQSRRTAAVATVLMDRVIGLWSMISSVALLGAIFWLGGTLAELSESSAHASKVIITAAASIVVLSLAGWILMGVFVNRGAEHVTHKLRRIPKIGGLAAELWRVVCMFRNRQGSVALAVAMSWTSTTCFVLAFYCSALALWDHLPNNPLPTLAEHFLLVPLGSLVGAIPLFPGGAGISEAGFGGLYSIFGSASSNGVLASLVNRFVSWISGAMAYVAAQCIPSAPNKKPADLANASAAAETADPALRAAPLDEGRG